MKRTQVSPWFTDIFLFIFRHILLINLEQQIPWFWFIQARVFFIHFRLPFLQNILCPQYHSFFQPHFIETYFFHWCIARTPAVYDADKASTKSSVWWADFTKAQPRSTKLSHKAAWKMGNHEVCAWSSLFACLGCPAHPGFLCFGLVTCLRFFPNCL